MCGCGCRYLVAANYDQLKTTKPARWYLERAYKTVVAMYYQVRLDLG